MASMALAVKDIPLKNIAFLTYPNGAGSFGGTQGVLPSTGDAKILMDAIAADAQIVVTGDPGGGVVAGEDVAEPEPSATPSGAPTIEPEGPDVVELPSTISGQSATQESCTAGQTF
jgi:hypothetical protein